MLSLTVSAVFSVCWGCSHNLFQRLFVVVCQVACLAYLLREIANAGKAFLRKIDAPSPSPSSSHPAAAAAAGAAADATVPTAFSSAAARHNSISGSGCSSSRCGASCQANEAAAASCA